MTRLRQLTQLVLRVEDTPTRVAAAFGLGLFIAFFPLLGTHTALALALAFVLRLNRVALLAGAWVTNPWTIGPMLTFGTLVGCWLLGVSPATVGDVDWQLSGRDFYASLVSVFRPLLWPFVLGNLLVGMISGTTAFFIVRAVLRSRRAEGRAPQTPGV